MFGFGLLGWALVIVAIALVARWWMGGARSSGRPGDDRALEILRERYARGEVDNAEFDARKRDLS